MLNNVHWLRFSTLRSLLPKRQIIEHEFSLNAWRRSFKTPNASTKNVHSLLYQFDIVRGITNYLRTGSTKNPEIPRYIQSGQISRNSQVKFGLKFTGDEAINILSLEIKNELRPVLSVSWSLSRHRTKQNSQFEAERLGRKKFSQFHFRSRLAVEGFSQFNLMNRPLRKQPVRSLIEPLFVYKANWKQKFLVIHPTSTCEVSAKVTEAPIRERRHSTDSAILSESQNIFSSVLRRTSKSQQRKINSSSRC